MTSDGVTDGFFRVTILFFTLTTLDVLGKLEEELDDDTRSMFIDWIYELQLNSHSGQPAKFYLSAFKFVLSYIIVSDITIQLTSISSITA